MMTTPPRTKIATPRATRARRKRSSIESSESSARILLPMMRGWSSCIGGSKDELLTGKRRIAICENRRRAAQWSRLETKDASGVCRNCELFRSQRQKAARTGSCFNSLTCAYSIHRCAARLLCGLFAALPVCGAVSFRTFSQAYSTDIFKS